MRTIALFHVLVLAGNNIILRDVQHAMHEPIIQN